MKQGVSIEDITTIQTHHSNNLFPIVDIVPIRGSHLKEFVIAAMRNNPPSLLGWVQSNKNDKIEIMVKDILEFGEQKKTQPSCDLANYTFRSLDIFA